MKIEKGIPIPERHHSGAKEFFKLAEVGDSAVVRLKEKNSIQQAAKRHHAKVRCKATEDGQFRVWLVEKTEID